MGKDNVIWKVLGIFFIIATGLIHGIEVPDAMSEAAYKGWLFAANGLGSVLAAAGIFNNKSWGWWLGVMVAAGAILGYIASRTVGLPLIPAEPDAWFEPLGVASLIVEGAFIGVMFRKHQR